MQKAKQAKDPSNDTARQEWSAILSCGYSPGAVVYGAACVYSPGAVAYGA